MKFLGKKTIECNKVHLLNNKNILKIIDLLAWCSNIENFITGPCLTSHFVGLRLGIDVLEQIASVRRCPQTPPANPPAVPHNPPACLQIPQTGPQNPWAGLQNPLDRYTDKRTDIRMYRQNFSPYYRTLFSIRACCPIILVDFTTSKWQGKTLWCFWAICYL